MSCPVCGSYDVSRLFIASVGVDSCVCEECGATWEESRGSGAYVGRSTGASVVLRRE
jgi:transposase-like protein